MPTRSITAGALAILLLGYSYGIAQDNSEPPVKLSEYLENLREQFITLANAGGKDTLPLYVSPIEIELTTAVSRNAEGRVEFYVITAGGGVEYQHTQTMRFTVGIGDPSDPRLTMSPDTLMPPSMVEAWGGQSGGFKLQELGR